MKDLKKELIRYGRKIYADKFVIGTGGNISVRAGKKICIKASGVSLGSSETSDYNEVDLRTGKATCFKSPCSIEIPMHMACYRARPDIGAVVHTHPVYSTILGIIGAELGYISYEFMLTMRSKVPAINYNSAGSVKLADAVGRAIKKSNGALLKNHGIIVVGCDLAQAYERALALERAAKIYVLASMSGKVSNIPEEELARMLNNKRR
ncbi:MAG: class II aldolase/adducin family protein [Candidatus Omnitrophota bacterium]|nr:class II aldolase/adducin family protein [Candidatus Omnitrophota bacterium]